MKTQTCKTLTWRLLSVLVVLSVLTPATLLGYVPAARADTATLNPYQDSYVDQGNPGTNYGSQTNLSVRSYRNSNNRRTYVQFDLSSIPPNSTINSATLRMFMYDAPSSSRTYEVHRVTQAWTEGGITWNNQASYAGTTSTDTTGTSNNVWLEWNVRSDVQAFVNGTNNYGWAVVDSNESNYSDRLAYFYSREYGTAGSRPQLVIDYTPPLQGTIGDFVWLDANGNGVRDAGENTGISGVQVTLSGAANQTQTTSGVAEPNYNFTALGAGNYVVSVPATSGNYYLTTDNNLARNLPTYNSHVTDADFGFAPFATINGRVWYDANRDGTQNGGETGIADVTVQIYQGGTLVASPVTNASGDYTAQVPAGSYTVQVNTATLPAARTDRTFVTGGVYPSPVTVTPGQTAAISFGYDDSGVIGNLIWNDLNGNGIADGGEPGLNWQVGLTGQETANQTAVNGTYNFIGLPAGTYTVTVSVPGGWAQTNPLEHPLLVNLATGQNFNTADFGFSQNYASISGYVWYDPNRNGVRDPGETGLNAIGVTLRRGAAIVGTANSNANGFYFFGGLAVAGDYQVDVDQSDPDLGIRVLTTADPLSVPGVTLGNNYPNRNFGFAEPPSVTKSLYLRRNDVLDRTRPMGTHTSFQINDGLSHTWTQSPTMAGPLQFTTSNVTVWLYMDPTSGFDWLGRELLPSARVTLRYGGTMIGTPQQLDNLSGGGQWYSFSFAHPTSLAAGNAFSIQIDVLNCNGGLLGSDGNVVVYYDSYPDDNHSRIELPVYSYLRIDNANSGTYDGAYPGGAPSDTFLTADNVYFRLRASDPFGNYDISGATLSIPGVVTNTAMTRYTPNPDAATAVFQYARSSFTLGSYTYVMTATEGAEGEVSAVYSGLFRIIISDLTGSFKEVRSWPARQLITQTVPGAEIEYTVHISNTGDANAANVSVVDPIPAHMTYVAGSVSGAVYSSTLNAILWPGATPTGTVPAHSERTFTFRVQLDPVLDNGTAIDNIAYINDGVNQFARSNRVTIVSAPNLSTSSKAVDRATAEPGDVLAYTIALTNTGNMNASASLTDAIPINATFVDGSLSYSTGNGSYNLGNRTISWNGTVPGQNVNPGVVYVTFRAQVDFPLNNGTLITNTAFIDDGFAPNGTTPLQRQVVTTITSEPLIQANSSKMVDEPTASPGSTLHYTIRLVNGGKMNAPVVNLVDPIPAHTTYVNGSLWANLGTPNWDGANGRVTWTGPVNPGASVEIRFNVRADSVLDNGTVITNTATVTDNYHAGSFPLTATTTIVSAPDLRTSSKSVSASTAVPGQALNYEIHLANTGNMTATTRITDTLSADLVNVRNVTPAGASYNVSLHTITWAGAVGPGPEVVIRFTADVRNPLDAPQTIIYNTARVDDGIHTPFDIYPPAQTTVNATPDLYSSRKAVSATAANPGDVLTYTIRLTNTGTMNTWASVQDVMPNQTTYLPGSLSFSAGSGSYDPFNRWIQWDGPANPGAPVVITYAVTIDAVMNQPDTTIYNDARIDDGVHTPFLTPGVTTTVHAEPNLSTSTKVVDLDSAAPGQQLWYRITVRNSGRMVAHGASVSDTLPVQVTYLSGQFPTGGGYNATGRYIYWNGDVTPGTDVVIDYYVTVNDPLDDGTLIENTAEIRDGYTGHPAVVTDPANARTVVNSAPNLGTSTKTVDKGTAAPGDVLTYTVTLLNTGNMNARGAQVTDTIPVNTSYANALSASSGTATWDSTNNRILWTGTVTKGVPVVITFRVQTNSPLPNGTPIDNTAIIYDGYHADTLSRSTHTEIGSAPNLSASSKTVDRPTAEPGDVLTYTVVLRNTGNMNASVSMTDTLPANVTYVPGSVTGGATYSGGTVTWNGAVNAGARITFTYRVTVSLPLDNNTLIENRATVNDGVHPAFDTTPPAQTLIQSTPNLLTSDKAVSRATAAPGDTLVYTITLRNTGKMTAHAATMYDILPAQLNDNLVGLPYASSGMVNYTSYNHRLVWNGSVSPLQPVTVVFTATIRSPLDDGTQIINNATIGDGIHSTFDTEPAITIIHAAPILTTSTKAVNLGEATPGAQLRYTIVLTNTGNMVAQANVEDQLPNNVTYFSGPTASSGSATWDGFNNRVLWNGQVVPNTPVIIQYYVTVNNPVDNDTVITNTCDINDGYTTDIYNPPATSTHITSQPNLSTSTKAVDKATAAPNEEVEYTVTLVNSGNMVAHNAWMTDTLPANTAWAGGLTWTGGNATWDGSRVRWDGDVAPGTPVVIRFRVQLDSPLANNTPITNTATLNDGFAGHASLTRRAVTTVRSAPNLSTSTKTVDRATAHPGELLVYTLSLVNTGNMTATGVTLNDVLPTNTGWDGWVVQNGATYNAGTRTVAWTGAVGPGSPVVIQYRVAITSPLNNGTSIANTATINDGFPGHTPFDTTPATQTTIQSAPDLSTSRKAVNVGTASPGQVITYTITLTNTGDMNASAYVLDGIPANTSYVDTPGVWASSGAVVYNQYQNRVEWNGTIPVGVPVVIRYAVQIASPLDNGTLIWNTATVGDGVHSPFDTLPANTTVTAAPNLQPRTTKTANLSEVAPGGLLRYTINVVNDGNMTAGNAQVVDALPPQVTYASGPFASSGSAVWDSFNNRIVWSGAVLPGTPVTIQYDVRANDPLDDGTLITNTATVNDNFPGHSAFQTAPAASTTVRSAPNLGTSTKTVDRGTAAPGDRLHYTITLNNTGNMNATNVTVVDTLPPAYATLVMPPPPDATYDAGSGTLTWSGLVVNRNQPVALTFDVDLAGAIPNGTLITNTATITDGFAGHAGIQRQATTIIGSAPNLSTSGKEVSQTSAAPDDTLVYTITLRNTGNAAATGARITDTLPANTHWDSWVTQNGAVLNGNVITWTGNVASGVNQVIAFRVHINTPLDNNTPIANSATVNDNFAGHTPFTINAPTTTVHSAPNLATSVKAVNLTDARPGNELVYTITLANTGGMIAHGAIVLDEIPAYTYYVDPSANASSGTVQYQPAYNRIRWTGEVTPGVNVVITFRVRVDSPLADGTAIDNFANVDDRVHIAFDTNTVRTTIHADPNLSTSTKTVDLAEAAPGQALHYVITLRNTGDMTSQANVTDTLPTQVTLTSGPTVQNGPPASWDSFNRRITWNGQVAPVANVTIEYYATVNSPLDDMTVITNTATINDGRHPAFETTPAAQTTVRSAPNLSGSTKTVDRTVAAPGEVIEYTLILRNTGSMNAANVVLTDTLPTEVAWVGWTMQSGASYDALTRQVRWSGPVNVNQTVTIRYQVRLNMGLADGTRIENTATVDDGRGHISEIGPAVTTVGHGGLSISLSDGHDQVQPGERLTYTIAFSGTDPLASGWVGIDIPANTTFVNATSGYQQSDNRILWPLVLLPPGFSGQRLLVVDVNTPLDNETVISTTAFIASGSQSNSDTDTDTVVSSPNLDNSSKVVSNPGARAGQLVTYRIVLTNTGNMHGHHVTITDTIPTDMIFEGNLAASRGISPTYTGGDVRWNGEVRVGAPVEITFDARVGETVPEGTIIENSVAINDGFHTDILPRSASITVGAGAPPGGNIYLPLILRDSGGGPPPGSYDIELTIRNCGNANAVGAFWVDLYINPNEQSPWWPISHGEGYDWFGQGAGFTVSTLGANQSRTLRLADAVVKDIPANLTGSPRLYAQVDWTPDPNGVVYEGTGGEQNNVADSNGATCSATPGYPDLIVESIRVVSASSGQVSQQAPATPLEGAEPAPLRPEPPQP